MRTPRRTVIRWVVVVAVAVAVVTLSAFHRWPYSIGID